MSKSNQKTGYCKSAAVKPVSISLYNFKVAVTSMRSPGCCACMLVPLFYVPACKELNFNRGVDITANCTDCSNIHVEFVGH